MSEFNILLGADGPVIIDLPQAVDAAANNHAPRMLVRDVDNLRRFFGRFAPELTATDYGKEICALYESGALHPDVELTGHFEHVATTVDLESIMREIEFRAARGSGPPDAIAGARVGDRVRARISPTIRGG